MDNRKGLAPPTAEEVVESLLAGQEEGLKRAGRVMLREARPVTRYVVKKIPGAPGLVLDLAEVATAKDKWRAGSKVAGGAAGAALGGALAGPVGAAAGSIVGERAGAYLYDHRDDISDRVDGAWRGLATAAGERVMPYTPLPRMYRAMGR